MTVRETELQAPAPTVLTPTTDLGAKVDLKKAQAEIAGVNPDAALNKKAHAHHHHTVAEDLRGRGLMNTASANGQIGTNQVVRAAGAVDAQGRSTSGTSSSGALISQLTAGATVDGGDEHHRLFSLDQQKKKAKKDGRVAEFMISSQTTTIAAPDVDYVERQEGQGSAAASKNGAELQMVEETRRSLQEGRSDASIFITSGGGNKQVDQAPVKLDDIKKQLGDYAKKSVYELRYEDDEAAKKETADFDRITKRFNLSDSQRELLRSHFASELSKYRDERSREVSQAMETIQHQAADRFEPARGKAAVSQEGLLRELKQSYGDIFSAREWSQVRNIVDLAHAQSLAPASSARQSQARVTRVSSAPAAAPEAASEFGAEAPKPERSAAWQFVGSLVKGMADSFGILDIAGGLKDLFTGQPVGAALKQIGLGLVKCAGELTGISSVVMGVQAALAGNWAMAGLCFGMAAMQFFFIGKVGSQMLKSSVTSALEKPVQELSENVLKEVTKRLSQETLTKMGTETADAMAKELAKVVTENGAKALTAETIQEVGKRFGMQIAETELRKIGFEGIVKDAVKEFLEANLKSGVLAQKLMESGSGKWTAKLLANRIAEGQADTFIKQMLEDGITQQVKGYVANGMESAFKDRFGKILLNQVGGNVDRALLDSAKVLNSALREQAVGLAAKSGCTVEAAMQQLTVKYVEAGWKGAVEGIEMAVRKLAREGIEKAFDEYRSKKGYASSDLALEEKKSDGVMPREEAAKAVDRAVRKGEQGPEAKPDGEMYAGMMVKYAEREGYRYRMLFERDKDGRWNLAVTENVGRIGDADPDDGKLALGNRSNVRQPLTQGPRAGTILGERGSENESKLV